MVEPDESDTMLKLSATVRCFVCNSKSNVVMTSKKLVGGRRGKPNWSISNFQSHIRILFKGLTSGNRQSDQHLTGLDAFISTRNQGGSSQNDSEDVQIIPDVDENRVVADTVATVSKKRKHNVITDEVENEIEVPDSHSGECLPGVLMRQNTPSGEVMP